MANCYSNISGGKMSKPAASRSRPGITLTIGKKAGKPGKPKSVPNARMHHGNSGYAGY